MILHQLKLLSDLNISASIYIVKWVLECVEYIPVSTFDRDNIS